jgi:HAE1 family hydrophobic/amphiphilic exporter-1
VGEVAIVDGLRRAINVWVEANRLAAYRLPITAVRDALVHQNIDVPGGNVAAGPQEQTLRTMGRLTVPRTFNDLVIATVNGTPIQVRDIGWAEDGTKEQRSVSRLNGVPTVTLNVRRQSGVSTIAVIDAVKTNLRQVAAPLPPDVFLEVIRDQSRYIAAVAIPASVVSSFAMMWALGFTRLLAKVILAASSPSCRGSPRCTMRQTTDPVTPYESPM